MKMNRYYINMTCAEGKPELFSLLEWINSVAEKGVLTIDQSQMIEIIRLDVDGTLRFKESTIKRVT
jgi:hypothetical protein